MYCQSNRFLCVLALIGGVVFTSQAVAEGWRVGLAKVVITPGKLMWMSGYASRNRPAEGTYHDLWAKAVCFEDGRGERAVLITSDLIGINANLTAAICAELASKYQLERRQIAISTSHTHSGPVVGGNLRTMFFYDETQQQLIDDYTNELQAKLIRLVGEAIENLAPASVQMGVGKSLVAVNRRNNPEAEVPQRRIDGKLLGPSDYDVPVLVISDHAGNALLPGAAGNQVGYGQKARAVIFGYACHATTLSFYQWCGDWPGFAQIELENAHPDMMALFWAGCGADQNPIPRREVAHAQEYGKQMFDAVEAVLTSDKVTSLTGNIQSMYHEIDLPFDTLPDQAQLQSDLASSNKYVAARAKMLLETLADDGKLPATYAYPIQSWALGDQLDFVILGGEVVVDYALRLKSELRDRPLFIAAYANDVMAYIPSKRVLLEGGYEGATSMVYYGRPTTWAPAVEELLITEVHRQVKSLRVSQ